MDKSNFFNTHGFPKEISSSDKKIFDFIKNSSYEYITRDSHSYKPEFGEFRVSSIGYCARKILIGKNMDDYISQNERELLPEWFLSEIDEKNQEIEPGAHIAGQVIHEIIQTAIGDKILGMEEEIGVTGPSFALKGHYDLLVEDENGEKIVIDIKSTSSPRKYLTNPKHLTQLMTYQGLLGGIKGALLYVHRNTWEMTYSPQDFDKEEYSKIISKAANLALHERKKSLPNIEASIYSTECSSEFFRCQFYSFCYQEELDQPTT